LNDDVFSIFFLLVVFTETTIGARGGRAVYAAIGLME